MANYKLSRLSLIRMNNVDAILTAIVTDAIRTAPFDFGIAWMGGFRTAVEQNRLYHNKKSKCDGYIKKSKHQSGKAFDIVCYREGKITWEPSVFSAVADHIIATAKSQYNNDLTWGGNWKFKDMPHFQIK